MSTVPVCVQYLPGMFTRHARMFTRHAFRMMNTGTPRPAECIQYVVCTCERETFEVALCLFCLFQTTCRAKRAVVVVGEERLLFIGARLFGAFVSRRFDRRSWVEHTCVLARQGKARQGMMERNLKYFLHRAKVLKQYRMFQRVLSKLRRSPEVGIAHEVSTVERVVMRQC